MKNNILKMLLFAAVFLTFSQFAGNSVFAAGKVTFKIKVDSSVATTEKPLAGRLLIFMRQDAKSLEVIQPDFQNPKAVWMAGVEVANLTPGKSFEFDADAFPTFPDRFSAAPAGEYQAMALLDQNHSYTYDGMSAGDLYSSVVKINLSNAENAPELTLSKIAPERKINYPENLKIVEFESPMLSAFWGRPIKMQASVLLPPSYDKSGNQKYPTVFNVHGYGGNHLKVFGAANTLKAMEEGKRPEMINVYLNGNCPLGHHVFADSANNGPWGTALVKEFIPFLEKQFRMDARPSGRFLTGHSSGGWSTLWVMINHPDFFGGTWSTSPDPVDFRNFTGPDITKYPPQNAYRDANGKPYNLVRNEGKEIMSLEEYAKSEIVQGLYGGQMASFDAVFSPKGDDGQPMHLFDRETGRIDPFVQKAWEKYDISLLLRDNWTTLGPKLKGKLHIIVGTADTFHLDEAVRLLDAELKKLGSDAKQEMYAIARPKAAAAKK